MPLPEVLAAPTIGDFNYPQRVKVWNFDGYR